MSSTDKGNRKGKDDQGALAQLAKGALGAGSLGVKTPEPHKGDLSAVERLAKTTLDAVKETAPRDVSDESKQTAESPKEARS